MEGPFGRITARIVAGGRRRGGVNPQSEENADRRSESRKQKAESRKQKAEKNW
jgi:hypothetical protein